MSPMTGFRILALVAVVAAVVAVAARGTTWAAAASHDVASGASAGLGWLFGSEDEPDEDDPGDGPERRPAPSPSPVIPVATALVSAAVGALAGGFVALRVRRVWVRLRERFTVR